MAWGALGASRGLFAGDSGVKYAQSVALWQSGFGSRALPSQRDLDPDLQLLPLGYFSRMVDGERQGIYSVVFTALCAPAIGLLGAAGAWIVPTLGCLLLALGLQRLGERLGVSSLAVVVSLFTTPLLLYATQLQEHTLATGLIVLALAGITRREREPTTPFLSGLLAGLAATLRPEGYLAAAAVGLALLVGPGPRVRPALRFALGAALVVGAYWGVNLVLSDTIDPLIARNVTWDGALRTSLAMLIGWVKVSPWLILGPLGLALLATTIPEVPRRWLLVPLVTLALVYFGALAHEKNSYRLPMGLFAVTPLAALGLAAPVASPRWRQGWVFAVAFLAAALLLNKSEDAGGLQVGARLLMPALPVLLLLAVGLVEDAWRQARGGERWLVGAPALVLTLIGGAVALLGYAGADRLARGAEAATRASAACPGTVVATRIWWASQVVAPVLSEGKRLVNNHGEPAVLFDRMTAAGVTDLAYLSDADPPAPWTTTSLTEGWIPVRCVTRTRSAPSR